MDKKFYFCAGLYGEIDKQKLQVVTSSEGIPYVKTEDDKKLLNHCTHHSALYEITVEPDMRYAYKVNNKEFEMNDIVPEKIDLNQEADIRALLIPEIKRLLDSEKDFSEFMNPPIEDEEQER